jgi:hypothetical protein
MSMDTEGNLTTRRLDSKRRPGPDCISDDLRRTTSLSALGGGFYDCVSWLYVF